MADNIEHRDKGELVANCDQLQNNEVVVTTPVESRIMSIRGNQIMIDRDLAELYEVETKRLNEAVKRNIERFPERFRFQLTKEEMAELVANCDRFNSLKHSTVRSYAFTEQGVAMLSTVLRSETAIRVSIRIMLSLTKMHTIFYQDCRNCFIKPRKKFTEQRIATRSGKTKYALRHRLSSGKTEYKRCYALPFSVDFRQAPCKDIRHVPSIKKQEITQLFCVLTLSLQTSKRGLPLNAQVTYIQWNEVHGKYNVLLPKRQ